MQLDSFTFNHLRLERLNTQTVKRRCTVQQYRMSFHYMLKNIPDHRFLAVNNLLRGFYGLHNTAFNQFTYDKRFVKFCSHQLRNTAFTHFQLGTYNDYRTSRVVNTLTEQILTETSLLTFQTVWQWFQRTVSICLNSTWFTWVVEQWIHRFLKHTFFITQNYFGSLDLDQTFQTVITNNDTTIQVIQIRSSKTTTIQRNQRTKFRRNNRYDTYDHPFRFVASTWCTEWFYNLQTFQRLVLTLLWSIVSGTMAQFIRQRVQIQTGQQVIDSLCTHLGDEFIRVCIFQILIFFRKCIQNIQIFLLWKQIIFSYAIFRLYTRLNNNITLIINNGIEFLGRQSQQVTYLIRKRTEIPDVSHRHNQLDMSHPFTTHFLFCNFHTATVTHNPFITDTFVLTTMAFVIFDRTKDTLTEQAITFRFVRTVVNGFRL